MKIFNLGLQVKLPLQFFLTTCIGFILLLSSAAWALQPPREGEVEKMKAEGTFQTSLQNAREGGNYKISPHLFEKLKRKFLQLQGVPQSEIDLVAPAPPVGRQGGLPSIGAPNYFVLLIEFQDITHSVTSAVMDDMHFGDGNPADYPRESLNNYYDRASYGLLDLSNGSTLGWYQTAYNRPAAPATKAGWGAARRALISEALNTFDATHDFSQYDNNGDGVIDYFIVYWTGPTGDWATYWWAWNTYYGDNTYTLDGVSLNNYSWQPETDFPATTLHETGHSLGLPDLYEYGGATLHGGVGNFDIMDGNVADLNCFWKWMLDWYTPTVVDASRQRLTLNDTESQDCVLIWPGVSTDDLFSEFFIVQNRQTTGNDEDVWFSPDGLPIWHIDATLNAAGNNFEYDNSFTAHKLVRLMEADGLEEIESGGSADIGDLYSVGDTIGPDTSPSSDRYDGTDSCVRVWNVVDDGTAPGDTMTADYSTICNTPPVCVREASLMTTLLYLLKSP
jgi:M6 family metalloprotease-like protein